MLLADDRVKKVYALNRPSSSASILERHKDKFVDRGLDIALLESERLTFIEGDASQEYLGVGKRLYEELQGSVTTIIHNAWKLDFNLSLSSFESHVGGTRNLVDFALSGSYSSNVRFLFTSTIAAAQSWGPTDGLVPEEPISNAGYAVGGGYGEGKYVAEQILAKSGLHATSFRIGQVSGGTTNGAWSTAEWLPILVKSSIALGALPDADGVVSWLPADAVAGAILDVGLLEEENPPALNLVHPRPVQWRFIMETLANTLGNNSHISLIPFSEWFELLERHAARGTNDSDVFTKMPAIKLLDFFKGLSLAKAEPDAEVGGLAMFATDKLQRISTTIRELGPIGPQDIQNWGEYWKGLGFLA